MICLIWAMTKDYIIGKDDHLPWKIKAEMTYFQQLTIGKTVLMGAKTLLSIGHPLKNRNNIVISRKPEKLTHFAADNCIIRSDLLNCLAPYQDNNKQDLFIIGGARIYQQTFLLADYLYISVIKQSFSGNVKFPITDFSAFKLIKTTEYQEFTALVYQRKDS